MDDEDPDDLELRRMHMQDLIERSSFGTPEAVAFRASTPPTLAPLLLYKAGFIDERELIERLGRALTSSRDRRSRLSLYGLSLQAGHALRHLVPRRLRKAPPV